MDAADRPGRSLPQLAARAQLGDRRALEALLRGLADQLRPHVEQIMGDRDSAEDVLQDVLIRVAEKLPGLREHAWVRAWAYRIATRAAVRELVRARRITLSSIDAAAELPALEPLEDAGFDPELLARIPAEVAALPEACQVAIRLHYLHGLTQPEVAEVLSIPVGTVKSRIAFGLRRLRARIPGPEAGRP